MRLTVMTDYALRLLMHVAQQPERLCTIQEVAQVYAISETHLMKVTHRLAQEGFIETVRGKGGGMRLAMKPSAINLGDLVRRIEPDFALVECLGSDNQCSLAPGCRLTGILDGATQAFLNHLKGHSLADLLPGDPAPSTPYPVHALALRRARHAA